MLEERQVDGSVTRGLVQLRREAQQHSPDRRDQPVERLDQSRVVGEIGRVETDLPEDLWHLAQQVECFSVRLSEVDPEAVQRHDGVVGEPPPRRVAADSPRPLTPFLANATVCSVKREILEMDHPPSPASRPLSQRPVPAPFSDSPVPNKITFGMYGRSTSRTGRARGRYNFDGTFLAGTFRR